MKILSHNSMKSVHRNVIDKLLFIYGLLYYIFGKHPFLVGCGLYLFSLFSSWHIISFFEGGVNLELCKFHNFRHFHFATASTIGYGDLTPMTRMGREFIPYIFFIGGSGLMTIAGGLLATVVKVINLYVKGKIMSFKKKHIIVYASSKLRAEQLLRELVDDQYLSLKKRSIIVCTNVAIESLPQGVEFIKYDENNLGEVIAHTGAQRASGIIVDLEDDGKSLEMCVMISAQSKSVHTVVNLKNSNIEDTILQLKGNIECILAGSPGAVARAVTVPGNNNYNRDVNQTGGQINPFIIEVPSVDNVEIFDLFRYLHKEFNIVLRYLVCDGVQMNYLPHEYVIKKGDLLGCTGQKPIDVKDVDWNKIIIE